MPAISPTQPQRSTFAQQFGGAGLSSSVRALTTTLVGAVPRTPAILSLRADVMKGNKKPVEHLLRLCYAAVDGGVEPERVTQWARDFIALVEQYAARRERRQSAGVLAFQDAHARHVTRSIREDADADVATATVDMHSVESLRTARAERLEAIAADRVLVDCYTRRIAELVGQEG